MGVSTINMLTLLPKVVILIEHLKSSEQEDHSEIQTLRPRPLQGKCAQSRSVLGLNFFIQGLETVERKNRSSPEKTANVL